MRRMTAVLRPLLGACASAALSAAALAQAPPAGHDSLPAVTLQR
jgi:hypothetical protein